VSGATALLVGDDLPAGCGLMDDVPPGFRTGIQ
jgi:hypothetical protein